MPTDPRNNVQISQFADDLGIWTSAGSSRALQLRLQKQIRDLETWCSKWRIKLNAAKTQYIVFSKKNKPSNPKLTIFGTYIIESASATLLGIKFDKKLTMGPHIKDISTKARQRASMLTRLRGKGWGFKKETLVKVYKQFVRPVLEYGAIVTSQASKSQLKKLQIAQNMALRIALSETRYTPTALLHGVADIPFIVDRLNELAKDTYVRIEKSELIEDLLIRKLLLA